MSKAQASPDFAWRFEQAQANLAEFVVRQALTTASKVQFRWEARADAPSTYDELKAAYTHSRTFGSPLPISNENNENSVYLLTEANIAFRFWHDCLHIRTGLTFDLLDEVALGRYQSTLTDEVFGSNSMEGKIIYADLVGQARYLSLTKSYPGNQLRFVRRCLAHGIDEAILNEFAAS